MSRKKQENQVGSENTKSGSDSIHHLRKRRRTGSKSRKSPSPEDKMEASVRPQGTRVTLSVFDFNGTKEKEKKRNYVGRGKRLVNASLCTYCIEWAWSFRASLKLDKLVDLCGESSLPT
eukprot:1147670-Pelagomonas_calceolata.AAC.4